MSRTRCRSRTPPAPPTRLPGASPRSRGSRPVVAVVRGPAVGVGVSLALAADLTVVRSDAFFSMPFTSIGLMPDGGATALVAASAGRAISMRMSLLGERLSAQEAGRAGLVAAVYEQDVFESELEKLTTRLSGISLDSIIETKRAINDASLRELEGAFARERDGQIRLTSRDDFRSAILAFTAKRTRPESEPTRGAAMSIAEISYMPRLDPRCTVQDSRRTGGGRYRRRRIDRSVRSRLRRSESCRCCRVRDHRIPGVHDSAHLGVCESRGTGGRLRPSPIAPDVATCRIGGEFDPGGDRGCRGRYRYRNFGSRPSAHHQDHRRPAYRSVRAFPAGTRGPGHCPKRWVGHRRNDSALGASGRHATDGRHVRTRFPNRCDEDGERRRGQRLRARSRVDLPLGFRCSDARALSAGFRVADPVAFV